LRVAASAEQCELILLSFLKEHYAFFSEASVALILGFSFSRAAVSAARFFKASSFVTPPVVSL